MIEILENKTFVCVAMSVIVFAVTQGLKWVLVKPFTSKLNKRAKTILNTTILLIALAAAVLVEFLYSKYLLKDSMNLIRALGGWSGASLVYDVYERIVKSFDPDVKVENPYKTEEGEVLEDTVEDVLADGKVDTNDSEAVKNYLDFVNKVKK